jgi:ABC-type oligopeptide transport system substrate-binding subunit
VTNLIVTLNNKRKPFDDVRVRQALTRTIDRWGNKPRSRGFRS